MAYVVISFEDCDNDFVWDTLTYCGKIWDMPTLVSYWGDIRMEKRVKSWAEMQFGCKYRMSDEKFSPTNRIRKKSKEGSPKFIRRDSPRSPIVSPKSKNNSPRSPIMSPRANKKNSPKSPKGKNSPSKKNSPKKKEESPRTFESPRGQLQLFFLEGAYLICFVQEKEQREWVNYLITRFGYDQKKFLIINSRSRIN